MQARVSTLTAFIALSLINLSTTPSVRSQETNRPNNLAEPSSWLDPSFWATIDGKPIEDNWDFTGDEIRLVKPRGGSGSLLSPPLASHFTLEWKWKIEKGTNSGLKYRVHKHANKWLGLEYQIIDQNGPSSTINKSSTGAIYDLVSPSEEKNILPPGEWNQAKVSAKGDQIQHFLNGVLIAECSTNNVEWKSNIAKSKFWGIESFASSNDPQRIMLTDHGGRVSFKDFRWVNHQEVVSKTLESTGPYLANGLKHGWVKQSSATIWTRTTRNPGMNLNGPEFLEITKKQADTLQSQNDETLLLNSQLPPNTKLDQMLGSCPGTAAEVRLSYFPEKQTKKIKTTDWKTTIAANDFAHQWQIDQLLPNQKYVAIVETRPIGQKSLSAVTRGHFRTAPKPSQQVPINFCLTTCHDFLRRDDGFQGHKIYPSMAKLNPHFTIHAGDIEYYDKPFPWALTKDLMRYKWNRIFALPNNRDFYANHSAYFLKDDHDTLKNDCWPGQTYGSVTFEEGKQIFNEEQFPTISQRYQTIQWGKDLQIWLLEGRDYRSPNNAKDGPEKTILGEAQKTWLFRTLDESAATFKLIVSPTPIVGPDRKNKRDNHANPEFAFEGEELRNRIASYEGTIVFCGDRHWQYASIDRETGIWEFGCGPGSEKHQFGWREGDLRPDHKFLRVAGGFLSGEIRYSQEGPDNPELTLRHHKVTGSVVSEFSFGSE